MREKTPAEVTECARQMQLIRDGDIQTSLWFTVFSDGNAMTVGREDTISIIGTKELANFMEEI